MTKNEKTDEKTSGEFEIDRRQMLKSSIAAMTVAAIGPVALLSGGTASALGSDFTEAYFSDQRGTYFQVDAGSGGWNSLEVVDVVGSDASPRLEQFTVRFRGSHNMAFGEGTYAVVPPEGNSFELYMQPAGSDDDGVYYDATFALIKPLNPSCAGPA